MKLCGFLSSHLYLYRVNDVPRQNSSLKSKMVHSVLRLFTVKQIKRFIQKLTMGKGDHYAAMAGAYKAEHLVYPVEYFEPAVSLPFGVSSCAVPKDYDRVLRILYGDDYMELPPVEKRVTHHPMKLSFDLEGDSVNE